MFKNLIILSLLLLLTNCGITGSTFLGPTYTGIKTGSVYQTSLSYSTGKFSGKLMNQIRPNSTINHSQIKRILLKRNSVVQKVPFSKKDPVILLAYKVDNIEISDVLEPEPLP